MKKEKNIYTKLFIYIGILVVLIVLLFILCKSDTKEKVINKYNYEGDINYQVILNDDKISKQKTFIASTIKNIKVNFNYKYELENISDIKYSYEIVGNVISTTKESSTEDNEVYNNEYVLVNNNNELSTKEININESVTLDYNLYNQEAIDFDKSVNIGIKSKLVVKLNLYLTINDKEEKLTSYINIPLEENTFSILKVAGDKEGKITSNIENKFRKIFIMSLIALILVDSVIIVMELVKIFRYTNEHYSDIKYNKIMSDYDNIIVPVKAIPKCDNAMIARVLYFKSMIDIQKELHVPILCFADKKKVAYLIYSGNILYLYILNDEKEKI